MSDSPIATQDELAKVRRLECHQNGHDVDAMSIFAHRYPVRYLCSRCGKEWQAPDGDDIETLAEQLHDAASQFRISTQNVAEPRWFAFRDDLKEPYRELAIKLTYKWAGIGD